MKLLSNGGPLLAVILFIFNVAPADATGDAITQDELVRRTQDLCDAVAPGNQEP